MISELAKVVFEFLKLAPRYLVAVAIMSGVLLFSGDGFLNRLGVLEFTKTNRSWLGLVFLGSSALFGVWFCGKAVSTVKNWHHRRKLHGLIIRRLQNLTEDEKQILRFYIAEQTRANTLRMDDGVVKTLEASRIIFRSSQLGNLVEGFPYNITEFAWDYLNLHPQLLLGSTDTYRTDKQSFRW